MAYNKSSTKKRIKHANSTKSKIKNKLNLTGIQIALIAFIVVFVIGSAAVLGVAKGIIDSSPDISRIDVVPTGYSTTVLADDGTTELATLVGSGANREYVTIDQIPKYLQQAFVAIEDARFYEHNGIDLQGIVRAGVATVQKLLTGSGRIQGASTITQQLIKNNVLVSWTGETTFLEKLQRKIQEQYLALKLEEQINDKDWILENYLNTINLGSNTLGVQSASNKYFGKDVSELTLSECAVIAGITQNPYGYDPIRFPEKSAERRERVLNAMLDQKYITKEQYDEALADPVYDRIASYNVSHSTSYNTYFVDALIDDVVKDLVERAGYTETDAYKAIYQGGLTIVSTQNVEMQKICDEEANNLANYPKAPKYSFNMAFSIKRADGTIKHYSHQTMLNYYNKKIRDEYAEKYPELFAPKDPEEPELPEDPEDPNNKEEEPEIVIPEYSIVFESEQACLDAIQQYKDELLKEGDSILAGSEALTITLQPQVAMTVIDQSTGEVKALVGGRGDKTGNRTWNRATDTKRQPGSTFKILTCYAPALDAGGRTLASVQDDAPYTHADGYTVENYTKDYYTGWTTIREAILISHNVTAVKNAEEIGVGLCYEYALKFGFTSIVPEDRNLSLPLGGITNGVTNLELTTAYAAIANEGEYIEPSFYTKIYDHDGNLILDNNSQERHTVVSEETAWLLTDAMCDVMTSGTGTSAYFGSTMKQAGKSGTTSSYRDTLFAGFTPYYTCVVWGGNDDNSIQDTNDCTYSKAIWRAVMKRIHEDLEYRDFKKPSTITTATVCMDSGLVPLDGVCSLCPKGNPVYEEYFTISTVPMKKCNHHVTLDICSTTGKIASAKCPESGIIQKVFITGSDPKTIDKAYIATEEFLSTVCTAHSTKPSTNNQDSNKPDNNQPDNGTSGNETPDSDKPDSDKNDSDKNNSDNADTNKSEDNTGNQGNETNQNNSDNQGNTGQTTNNNNNNNN